VTVWECQHCRHFTHSGRTCTLCGHGVCNICTLEGRLCNGDTKEQTPPSGETKKEAT
jgi:hypothetical protein